MKTVITYGTFDLFHVGHVRVPACYFRSVSQVFGVKFQKIG